MRKLIFVLPFLFLTSCATTGGLSKDQINQIIAQVQAYTAKVCAFQPTASSLVSLVSAFYSQAQVFGDVVNAIGDAICKAPTTSASVRRGVTTVTKIVPSPRGNIVIKGTPYGAVR